MNALNEWFTELLADNTMFTANTLSYYGSGLVTTVQLVFLALVIGALLAIPLAVGRGSRRQWIRLPIYLFTYVFRGTPLLIQLYLVYYGVVFFDGIQDSMWWPIFREAFYPALIAFTLNTAAYTTEIFHGAIKNTARGEIEAARAYGMSKGLMMRRIILPSAFRRALPAYGNEVIFMLHASAVAGVITIMDIFGVAKYIGVRFYSPLDAYAFAGLLYLCLTFMIMFTFRRLERRLLAHLRPREA